MKKRGRLSVVALGILLVIGGCTPSSTAGADPEPTANSDMATVKVERRDIVSVITLDVVVTARPSYAVTAAKTGPIRYTSNIKPGLPVKAGTVLATQNGTEITTPVDAVLEEWLTPSGAYVHERVPVAVLRYVGFGATGALPPVHAFRMYSGAPSAKVALKNGPGPAPCTLLTPVQSEEIGKPVPAGGPELPMLCAIAPQTQAFTGVAGVLALQTAERRDVLTLPVEAVAGSSGTGTVTKLTDGGQVVTEAKLGITDGISVEIVDGLAEGDEVLPFGPNLRPETR